MAENWDTYSGPLDNFQTWQRAEHDRRKREVRTLQSKIADVRVAMLALEAVLSEIESYAGAQGKITLMARLNGRCFDLARAVGEVFFHLEDQAIARRHAGLRNG